MSNKLGQCITLAKASQFLPLERAFLHRNMGADENVGKGNLTHIAVLPAESGLDAFDQHSFAIFLS